jgi:hypothetical protein
MPDPSTLARLVAIAEFMLQAKLPPPTQQLLATTVDTFGEALFADWLVTYDAVTAATDDDQRLIIRESTQERWVNGMRTIPHPLPQTLVAIYDAANAPIAPGIPPLTEESANAVLDIFAFQSSVVRGADVPVTPPQRDAWKRHLVACYPSLAPPVQQWIGAAPLTAPMMREGWRTLTPLQQQAQRQIWATDLPQLTAWIQGIAQGQATPPLAPAAPAVSQQQMTPQQARQQDQMIIHTLQNVANSNYQAMMSVAHNFRY